MVRRPAEETRNLTQRFSLATQKRRSWMFGWNLRRVALLACETLLPLITLLPVTWQIRLMTYLGIDGSNHGPVGFGPCCRGCIACSEPRIMAENPFRIKVLSSWSLGVMRSALRTGSDFFAIGGFSVPDWDRKL